MLCSSSKTCNSVAMLGFFPIPKSLWFESNVKGEAGIVHSSNSVPTHFSKLDPENWIFSSIFFILNKYEQLPILLLQYYDHCNYISLLNLRKENFNRKLVVRNKSSLWDYHSNSWCCLFLTKNSIFKIYFKEHQKFNATITFHILCQYSFILAYIFSQCNLIES